MKTSNKFLLKIIKKNEKLKQKIKRLKKEIKLLQQFTPDTKDKNTNKAIKSCNIKPITTLPDSKYSSMPIISTDGSFNDKTKICTYAFVVIYDGYIEQRQGKCVQLKKESLSAQTAECTAVITALQWCKSKNFKEVVLAYDCQNIISWLNGNTEHPRAKWYQKMMKQYSDLKIHYVKVKAHTNILGNTLADKNAKELREAIERQSITKPT